MQQNRFAGLLTQVTAFMGAGGAESVEAMITKLEQLKGLIDQVHNQIRNPEKTTFVCVCIPEFLSIYETERLVQELSKSEIDTHNVVVNQVLFPDKDAEDLVEWYAGAKATLPQEAQDLIGKTIARKRMQDRYISQIFELYEDFHVILMPLLDNEVSYKTLNDHLCWWLFIPRSIPKFFIFILWFVGERCGIARVFLYFTTQPRELDVLNPMLLSPQCHLVIVVEDEQVIQLVLPFSKE